MDWQFIFSASVSYALGAISVAYCLAAIGLNMQFGYTGLLNFGQAAFLAAAGYGMAVMVTTFELSFWVGLVVGLLATLALALLLGLPTLRLRADYLAIVTIAAAEVVRLIVRSVKFKETLGGSDGLQQFADRFYELSPLSDTFRIKFGPFLFSNQEVWVMIVGWTLVAVFSLITYLLVRSPWGRILKGIREDEDAVRSLGKNVYWYKMQALMLGALMAGFGGFIIGIFFNAVSPDIYATALTFAIYTILILGGAARVAGPILGAILFAFLFQFVDVFLKEAVANDYITFLDSSETAQVRLVLVGIGLMLLMIYRPQGILGDRREIALDAR
jgi:branched-chain amino acid transport system permease protein